MISPKQVEDLILEWLESPTGAQEAYRKTLEKNLFQKNDVLFALQHLRDQIQNNKLQKWASQSNPDSKQSSDKVLFLHAGNLPLVGFQDVIASLISGCKYVGKVSKSDPYFLPSFLDFIALEFGKSYSYFHSLDNVPTHQFDKIVFSGSETSSIEILEFLSDRQMISPQTKKLIRTAHVSIYFTRRIKDENLPALSEAMFRYQNKGCRNVGIIISEAPLKSSSCALTDNMELFWMRSGVAFPINEMQKSYASMYRACGVSSILLDNVSIVQTEPELSVPQTIFYVHGGEDELLRIVQKYGVAIQSIYADEEGEVCGRKFEPIEEAQNPPMWWKPDGVDALKWLID